MAMTLAEAHRAVKAAGFPELSDKGIKALAEALGAPLVAPEVVPGKYITPRGSLVMIRYDLTGIMSSWRTGAATDLSESDVQDLWPKLSPAKVVPVDGYCGAEYEENVCDRVKGHYGSHVERNPGGYSQSIWD